MNNENPYDSVGIQHNMDCEYLLSYTTAIDTTEADWWARMYEAEENMADSLGLDWELVEVQLDSVFTHWYSLGPAHDPIDALKNCQADDVISEREAYYIRMIGQAFYGATDSVELVNQLVSIENEMVQVNWDPEEGTALRTVSIAKHSFCFWSSFVVQTMIRIARIAAADAEADIWCPYLGNDDESKEKRRRWVRTHSFFASFD